VKGRLGSTQADARRKSNGGILG
jgi:hypothetical protein